MRKLRYKDVKELAQGHTANKCWSWTQPRPGIVGSRLWTLNHEATLPGTPVIKEFTF